MSNQKTKRKWRPRSSPFIWHMFHWVQKSMSAKKSTLKDGRNLTGRVAFLRSILVWRKACQQGLPQRDLKGVLSESSVISYVHLLINRRTVECSSCSMWIHPLKKRELAAAVALADLFMSWNVQTTNSCKWTFHRKMISFSIIVI